MGVLGAGVTGVERGFALSHVMLYYESVDVAIA